MPSTLRPALSIALLALLPLASCEYFDDTVIPPVDHTQPYAVAHMLDPESADFILAADELWVTSDPDEVYYPTVAGYDGGGIRKLTLHGSWIDGIDEHHKDLLFDHFFAPPIKPDLGAELQVFAKVCFPEPWIERDVVIDLGEGEIGQVVSDGQWTGDAIRFRDLLDEDELEGPAIYRWSAESVDFHGNRSFSSPGWIFYFP